MTNNTQISKAQWRYVLIYFINEVEEEPAKLYVDTNQ
jgi:hypothetical protein